MKKFKDLIREFKDNVNNSNRGKNNNGDDHFVRIKEFMEKTPFTHITNNEDEIHFKSSHHAAEAVAKSLAKHEMGRIHAHTSGNDPMHEYFLASAGTHDDVLDAITNHIMNHPKLPYDLIDSVPGYISHIENEGARLMATAQDLGSKFAPKGVPSSIGEGQFRRHHHPDADVLGVHPHLHNDTHHLKNVINDIQDDPDAGYFIKAEEK